MQGQLNGGMVNRVEKQDNPELFPFRGGAR
jgi:hypothetical protein